MPEDPMWGGDGKTWKDGHPLGANMQQFLLENANYGIYVRILRELPCPVCYDPASRGKGAASSDCPECWGTGFVVDPVVTPFRSASPGRDIDDQIQSSPGTISAERRIAAFPRTLHPKTSDLFLECEWGIPLYKVPKTPDRAPRRIVQAFSIEAIEPAVEREIGWWKAGLQAYALDLAFIRRLLGLMRGLPLLDTKTWQQESYW